MYLQNLHTHTHFCDGKDSPEEIIEAARRKGFTSVGFSGHSYMWASKLLAPLGDRTQAYKEDIARLKKKYEGIMDVFCGLEFELYSKVDLTGFDYLIGSVHYLMCEGECLTFDAGLGAVKQMIDSYFAGDGLRFAKTYYETLAKLPQYGHFDIIGHFDLITKHIEKESLFDTVSKPYLHAAIEAAEALAGKIPYFEVNTGAIARGYRTMPYPSVPIIKELKRLGFGAVITSDCHDKEALDSGFLLATNILKECGFESKHVLTKQGFIEVPL